MNEVKAEYVMANTEVWWDINKCPIPDDCDPYCVAPSIESTLRDSGYAGPLTITAMGDLEDIPRSHLEAISSTGIVLKQIPNGIRSLMLAFLDIKPPVTILLISDSHGMACFAHPLSSRHAMGGYNILLSYPPDSEIEHNLKKVTSAEWMWVRGGLLKGSADEIIRQVEFPMFNCSTCHCEYPNLEDFTTHLSSKQHQEEELLLNTSKAQIKEQKDKEKETEQEKDDISMKLIKQNIDEIFRLLAKRDNREQRNQSAPALAPPLRFELEEEKEEHDDEMAKMTEMVRRILREKGMMN